MKDDYFAMATECHLTNNTEELSYFPAFKFFPTAVERALKFYRHPRDLVTVPETWDVDALIADMDRAGIDIGFALRESFMDCSYGEAPFSTNGWIMEQIAKYPDRLMFEANPGPILRRGVKGPIWEMEYLVKERGAKLIKVYQPEDEGPLNDPRLWPFYEKAQELGVPLTIHIGFEGMPGQPSKYTHPALLDDVLNDFPDLKVIAYHLGWPHCEETFSMADKFTNLYVGLSLRIGWFTRSPYRGYHLIGEAMQIIGGSEKLIFGLDWPIVDAKACVDYIKNLDMPDELVENWGYDKLTEQDKRNILGLNLARMLGIEPRKRI